MPMPVRPRLCLLCAIVALGLGAVPGYAGLKIFYLRHAESGGNVARQFETIPPDQRPPYVGNADTFSPLGWKQAAAVPDILAPYRIDFIAVSPLWRARNTIRPYLHLYARTAEIWPELREFGNTGDRLAFLGRDDLPPPDPDFRANGPMLILAGEDERLFRVRPDSPRQYDYLRGGAEGAADLVESMKIVFERIRREFGGTDSSILLVGHGTAGRHLLHALTGEDAPLKLGLKNAALWLAEEQPDGTFHITLANGEPITSDRH
ncbi:MAG: histidine phosphatase family protein [Verrucomicrobia bacterium]|nr:MAG: histidine phosphatase family protein [Verrucomicrobiota bacterium]